MEAAKLAAVVVAAVRQPQKSTLVGLVDWVDYMVRTGLYWSGAAPWSNVEPKQTIEYRLSGFAHSFLVALAGNSGGIDPYKLAPKATPDVDLGGRHLNELLFRDISGQPDDTRALIEGLRDRYVRYGARQADRVTVMGQFLHELCQWISDDYELRHLRCHDETGDVLEEGPDIAPILPRMFAAMWSANEIVRNTPAWGWGGHHAERHDIGGLGGHGHPPEAISSEPHGQPAGEPRDVHPEPDVTTRSGQ